MEEKTKENVYLDRTSKSGRYDKRLIIELVKLVEQGIPRREINLKYGLGKSSLGIWMKKYGSESYHQDKRKVYSNLEKRTIVAAIEQGRMTVSEAKLAYTISSEKSIRNWLDRSAAEKGNFSIPIQLDMAKSKKKTEKTNPDEIDLQKALQEAQLKIIALNTLIDVAEEQLKINIRKKSGARPSSE
jgi:transposase-like protein